MPNPSSEARSAVAEAGGLCPVCGREVSDDPAAFEKCLRRKMGTPGTAALLCYQTGFTLQRAEVARLEGLRDALKAIIIRCVEGDPSSNWLPVILRLARAALRPEGATALAGKPEVAKAGTDESPFGDDAGPFCALDHCQGEPTVCRAHYDLALTEARAAELRDYLGPGKLTSGVLATAPMAPRNGCGKKHLGCHCALCLAALAQPDPPTAPAKAEVPPALEWRKSNEASDYYEARVSERVFLDAIESHSGWKTRIWIRDQYDFTRLASPIEKAGLRTAEEAQAAGAQLLREWTAGLLPPPAASKEDGR